MTELTLQDLCQFNFSIFVTQSCGNFSSRVFPSSISRLNKSVHMQEVRSRLSDDYFLFSHTFHLNRNCPSLHSSAAPTSLPHNKISLSNEKQSGDHYVSQACLRLTVFPNTHASDFGNSSLTKLLKQA